jgi:phosphatidate cytidylyltransferase
MLLQRVATAVVLLLLIGASLLAEGAWPFALLTLLLIAAAGWEWGRLNQAPWPLAWAMGALVGLSGLAALRAQWAEPGAAGASPWWWAVVLLWVLGAGMALRLGPRAWPQLPRPARWLLGVVVLAAAWLALAQAQALGLNFMLSVLALVWVADIAAYFGGRRFGRRKLAPSISPGKTWEGAYGATVGVLVYGLLIGHYFLAGQVALPLWIVALLIVTAVSIIGDLFESLLKRKAGIKDSSNVLPGHGGVLDRIDSLTSTLPVVAMVWLLFIQRA